MKDKRLNKNKEHYDILIDNKKYKVLNCKISEEKHALTIKTKIKGQNFPKKGQFVITIPSQNISKELNIALEFTSSNSSIEHWEYLLL